MTLSAFPEKKSLKLKKKNGQEILARGLQISNLNKIGAMLGEAQKIEKLFFLVLGIFSGKADSVMFVGLPMYYKSTKFNLNLRNNF